MLLNTKQNRTKSVLILFFSLLGLQLIYSQPLSGNYTIGGNNPDFNTLQEAANSLIANGISGPTNFSIRPGLYTEQSGASPVMMLEQNVVGVSETNTITFKPDESSGGNVNNIILQLNGGTAPAGGRTVIGLNVDYVTISNVTVQDLDTSGNFTNSLIRIRGRSGQTLLTGIQILNCRLLGSPVFNEIPSTSSGSRGTTYGIWAAKQSVLEYKELVFNGNYIEKVNFGMFFNAGLTPTDVTIAANIIQSVFNRVDGNGNHGAGIHFARIDASSNLNILNNKIDFAGGGGAPLSGISLLTEQGSRYIKAVIDGNYILNRPGKVSTGTFQTNGFSAISVGSNFNLSNDIQISNNMIAGNYIRQPGGAIGTRKGVSVSCNNTKVYHNTIVNPFEIVILGTNEFTRGLEINSSDATVINNIIIDYGKNNSGSGNSVAYGIYDTTGLVSDHNIFDITSGQALAFVGGTYIPNLGGLQQQTGTDSNSIVKQIEFIDSSDVHLTECQMQDPDLIGIPLAEVTIDIDGDQRSATGPSIGADEAVLNSFHYWSDIFTENLPGSPFSIAAGKFDNIVGDGIAVPDYDNNQVLLYHNLVSSRSFELSNTLTTDFKPISVLFDDFDDDGNLDLIVGGQNPDGIKVFWGDGVGGFPQTSEVQTPGAVLNLIPEPFPITPDTQTIFVPFGEFFCYLRNYGNREVCFDFLYSDQFQNIDTLPNFIHSATVQDLNGDGYVEVTGVSHTSGHFTLISKIRFVDLSFSECFPNGAFNDEGFYFEYPFETGWYSYTNSIIKGDFDGDTDLDFVTLGLTPGTIIFVRYEGGYNFSYSIINMDDFAQALVSLDYDNDGDLDFATANYSTSNGITLFINDGSANFSQAKSCFQTQIDGFPRGIVASDFDIDGRTDIAVSTSSDQFNVLYNVGGPTAVEQQQINFSPDEYVLEQNYPNPFNPSTTFEFAIPQSSLVNLAIYNILGELVKTLVNEERPAGNHSIHFNANNLASGIYFYKLQAGSFVETKKMILIK